MENEKWETTLTQGQIIVALRKHLSTSQLIVVEDIQLGIDENEKLYAQVKGVKIPDAQSPDLPRKGTYTGHSTGV